MDQAGAPVELAGQARKSKKVVFVRAHERPTLARAAIMFKRKVAHLVQPCIDLDLDPLASIGESQRKASLGAV